MSDAENHAQQIAFLETCAELKMLDPTDIDSLRQSVGTDATHISQLALQQGLLTATDIDIALSIQQPLTVVPGYEIVGLVGRGGMGAVYQAQQLDLERTVALKTILLESAGDTNAAARFEREAKSLARLQHPNIIQALNFGQHHGRYYFAMEFVSGRTCEQAIHQERFLPSDKVWVLVRQVASGLLHALGQNLIHRDIKPANLILMAPPEGAASDQEIVKIADFGLAMFANPSADQMKLTTGQKVLGSPAYMSPQQFGGEAVDFRTDIYSLGASAWHMLFGTPPFAGNSIASLYRQKLQPFVPQDHELPFSIPDDQMRLLTRMMDPDPKVRPSTYESLIESIDRLDIGSDTATRPLPLHAVPQDVSEQPTMELSAVGAATSQTTEVLTPPNLALEHGAVDRSPRSPRFLLAIGLFLVVLGSVAFLAWPRNSRGPRIYTRVVESVPLFDGETLSGWDVGGTAVGSWGTATAPDDGTALTCNSSQGALSRRLPGVNHPRICLFVWPQENSGVVDIDFAFDTLDADTRGCLRFTDSKNLLGTKQTDFGDLSVVSEKLAPVSLHDRFHVVHIERQPTDWYIFVEEQLVGTIPITRVGDGAQMRLVVHAAENGQDDAVKVYFSDLEMYGLGESK